jgi:hypothetical protein
MKNFLTVTMIVVMALLFSFSFPQGVIAQEKEQIQIRPKADPSKVIKPVEPVHRDPARGVAMPPHPLGRGGATMEPEEEEEPIQMRKVRPSETGSGVMQPAKAFPKVEMQKGQMK